MTEIIAEKIPSDLLNQLEACKTLPSLPAVAIKVIELAKLPNAGTTDLAAIVETDPSLSAKILAAANSSFYSSSQFNSLQQAINRLGMEAALALALSFSIAKVSKKANQGLNLDNFWKRAVISGLVVREIKQIFNPNFDVERVYLAAILQDIGMLVLNELKPESYTKFNLNVLTHNELAKLEYQEFGVCHVALGYWLGKTWGLPKRFNNLILKSHRSPKQIQPDKYNQKVLALSGLVADIWLSKRREAALALAWQASQDYLNLTERQFGHLLLKVEDKLPEITQLFELSQPKKLDAFKLLQEAKQLLVERNLGLMQKLAQQADKLASLNLASSQLKQQLKKDALTGIYNRQFIKEQLEKSFNSAKEKQGVLSVIFIDLDFFKNINDDFGHAVGDDVLKAFATKLVDLTPKGCIAGRYGGEEFVVLLPNQALEQAQAFALNLQSYLTNNTLLTYKKEDIHLSASIGLATYSPKDADSFNEADDLVNAADKAMYDAKRTGRNRVVLFTAKGIEQLS